MRKITSLACIILAMASCSKNETTTPQGGERQIKANSTIDGAKSKAIVQGDVALTDINFLRKDDATANQTTFDFSGTTEITGARAVGGVITFGTAQTYDMGTDNYAYFRGYHPIGTVTTTASTTWTIDGKTDILLTDVWNAGKYSSPITMGMKFKHILARVEVVCVANNGEAQSAIESTWGNITKIEFVGAIPEMVYTYSTNVVASTGTAADFALLKGAAYTDAFESIAIPATGNTTVNAAAMLAPVANTSVSLKVTTVTGGEKTIPVTLKANLAEGQTHTITLTFKAKDKTITATSSSIEDWATGTTGGADVEI